MNSRDDIVLALTDDLDTSDGDGVFSVSQRRFALIGHYAFRTVAILIYFFCAWFTSSFVVPFVLVLVCLSIDFWYVKNISGRVLVGLRWSSYTSDAGKTEWRFDSRPAPPESSDTMTLSRRELAARAAQTRDGQLFWIGLVGAPAIWSLFLLVSVFSLRLFWALLCVIATCMSVANLYAYVRCRFASATPSPANLMSNMRVKMMGQMFTDLWSNLSPPRQPKSGDKQPSVSTIDA